jgi:hypothetical protein
VCTSRSTGIGSVVTATACFTATPGDRVDPLLVQFKAEESRKSSLTHELAALVDQGRLASLESRRLRQELTRKAAHVRELLARHEPGARRLLQTLLVDRLGFAPFEENGRRGYRFEGEATYGSLLAGLGIAASDGVPDGIRHPLRRPASARHRVPARGVTLARRSYGVPLP